MKSSIILTPKPSKRPRINGAKIFGARPGSPILFQIAATGQDPLTYSAENVPESLSLDSNTGLITGVIDIPDTYQINLTVSNIIGEVTKEIRIVIGDSICLTPPMGWNSWYCWSESISSEKIQTVAKNMKDKGLVAHGWTYVNIDDCWQGPRGGEYNGIQGNERFPDIPEMVEYIHSLGLKVGIYSTPWMGSYAGFLGSSAPTEDGDYSSLIIPPEQRPQPNQIFGRSPNSQRVGAAKIGPYWMFDKDAKQWADWQIDYVKVDWQNDVPTATRIAEDLKNCGRDIIFSMSNNAPFNEAVNWAKLCQLWRTTGDISEHWISIFHIGFSQEKWRPFAGPGHWIDPDMLQVGMIGKPNQYNRILHPTHLTPDEQYTQVSLWCLLSAPLILSCDIESLDEFTLNLLTNDEILEVDQDPLGEEAHCARKKGSAEIWSKNMENGDKILGIFNRGRWQRKIEVDLGDLGITNVVKARDLWRQQDLGQLQIKSTYKIPAHGVMMLRLSQV
jgi:alpha-galactosidase